MTTTTKADLLRQIEVARSALLKLLDRVPKKRWEEPGAEGTWSVRDVLGHIATWDAESASRVRTHIGGGKPDATSPDFNEREVKKQQGLSTTEIFALFTRNHAAAVSYLRQLPEAALQRPEVEKQIMGCMVHHYQEHTENLGKWAAGKPPV